MMRTDGTPLSWRDRTLARSSEGDVERDPEQAGAGGAAQPAQARRDAAHRQSEHRRDAAGADAQAAYGRDAGRQPR